MTSGAVIVALLGLGVGCAGMWLAWRLVRAAGGEGQDPAKTGTERHSGSAADEEHEQPAPEASVEDSPAGVFLPTGAWGQIGAVLALGGVCLLIPALFNLASTWPLAVGGLVAIAVGLALLWLLHKRKRNLAAEHGAAAEAAKPR